MLGVKRRVNAALDDNVAVERSVFVDSACIFQTRAEMEVLGELLQRCRRCDNFHHRRRYHLPLKIVGRNWCACAQIHHTDAHCGSCHGTARHKLPDG